jgi:hypothetical protein
VVSEWSASVVRTALIEPLHFRGVFSAAVSRTMKESIMHLKAKSTTSMLFVLWAMMIAATLGCQAQPPSKSVKSTTANTASITTASSEASDGSARQPLQAKETLAFGSDWPDNAMCQPILAVDEVAAHAKQYAGKRIRVQGAVAQVCKKRGCWLTLSSADTARTLFIKLPYPLKKAFPQAAIGQRAEVVGRFAVQQVPAEAARHFRRDAGASEAEVDRITGPQTLLRIKAPAIRITGIDQPRPSE